MQQKSNRVFLYLFFLLAFASAGSLACTFASDGGGGGTSNPAGILYLLDNQNTQVAIFPNATNLTGSQTVSQVLTGDPDNENTNPTLIFMQNPSAMAIDTARNILYVADSNQQAILAFTNASSLSGQTSAARKYPYSGSNGEVVDLFYDGSNDILYAADQNQQTVFKWAGISTVPLATNTGPTNQIYMGFPMTSMAVDVTHNLLYLGNPTASPSPAVQMYDGLLNLSNVTTNPTIASNIFTLTPSDVATQGFVNLDGMVVNPTVVQGGILYVSEAGYPSIEVFTDASSLENAQVADEEISGSSTTLVKNQLSKMILQSSSNNIWVIAGNNTISVWQNAQQLDPQVTDQAPNVTLTISGAGQIVSLALDMSR